MTAADPSFDAVTHSYTMGDGRIVPSVTQILHATGAATDFDELSGFSSRLEDQIAMRRALGTAVHADIHSFDDDDLDWASVDPRVAPYVRAWDTFRQNTGVKPLTRERRIYHPIGFAGTLDGVFLLPSGRATLIDVKIGDPKSAAAHLQTAAYAAGYELDHPESIDERWAVRLAPELAVPYRITPYTDWRDWPTFEACVSVYYAQQGRTRR